MQFNLRYLFMLVTLAAISCAALIYATAVWAAIYFTAVTGLLLAAVVLSRVNRGESAACWFGFAVFGWGYLLVLHLPIFTFEPMTSAWRIQSDGPPLVTSEILDWTYFNILSLVHKQPQVDTFGKVINGTGYPLGPDYARVGHSLFTLLFSLIGSQIAAWAYRRSQSSSPSP
jgi:hypothetical protein